MIERSDPLNFQRSGRSGRKDAGVGKGLMAAGVDQAIDNQIISSSDRQLISRRYPEFARLRGIILVLDDVYRIAFTRVTILEIGVFSDIRETHIVAGFKRELRLAAQLVMNFEIRRDRELRRRELRAPICGLYRLIREIVQTQGKTKMICRSGLYTFDRKLAFGLTFPKKLALKCRPAG